MRLYYYKDDNQKMLRKVDRENIVDDILQKTKLWHEDVQEVREDYDRINREIFPSTVPNKRDVKLIPDVYEQYQTYKANIFKSTYQNYDGMFDIEGQDQQSHDISAIYKASLVWDFYKIKLKNSLDAMLDDWLTKGEAAGFVHWDTKVTRKREQKVEYGIDPATGLNFATVVNVPVDEVTHSGPDIKRIDPLNLFFDKSQRYNWDMCGKIYRDFTPIQYILANTKYKFTKEERAELKEQIKSDPRELMKAKFADLFRSSKNIQISFMDFFGLDKTYNQSNATFT